MHRRWQDWVIAVALIALGVTGIWTLWGQSIADLFHPNQPSRASDDPAAPADDTAAPPHPPTPAPPGGPARGPF